MRKMKITEALVAEHAIFRSVFDQIERALPGLATLAEVRTVAGIVEGLLEGHGQAETDLAYLALDHVLEHNGELERMHQDHHEIDEQLRKVRAAKTGAEARRLLKAALAVSSEHFRSEERGVFPLLDRSLHEETLSELGNTWLQRQAARSGAATGGRHQALTTSLSARSLG